MHDRPLLRFSPARRIRRRPAPRRLRGTCGTVRVSHLLPQQLMLSEQQHGRRPASAPQLHDVAAVVGAGDAAERGAQFVGLRAAPPDRQQSRAHAETRPCRPASATAGEAAPGAPSPPGRARRSLEQRRARATAGRRRSPPAAPWPARGRDDPAAPARGRSPTGAARGPRAPARCGKRCASAASSFAT